MVVVLGQVDGMVPIDGKLVDAGGALVDRGVAQIEELSMRSEPGRQRMIWVRPLMPPAP